MIKTTLEFARDSLLHELSILDDLCDNQIPKDDNRTLYLVDTAANAVDIAQSHIAQAIQVMGGGSTGMNSQISMVSNRAEFAWGKAVALDELIFERLGDLPDEDLNPILSDAGDAVASLRAVCHGLEEMRMRYASN